MIPMQQAKSAIVEHVHLEKDALHIYVALIVFIGSCLLFKWKASQWKPWLVVLACALAGEAWDIRDRIVYHAQQEFSANWKDVWNTMITPSVLMLAARFSGIFRKG